MNERQKSILRILGEDRELSVSDLTERFSVSGVTIRQDLDYLQSQGLLRRVHGGAVLHSEEDIAHRLGVNFEAKLRIAELAASFVSAGDTIFIEAGSANALLARTLAQREGIRVVTNNLFIARTLKESNVQVVAIGGVYQHQSECVVGSLARLGIAEVNFTRAFIGVDGCSFDQGLTCSDMMRAEIAHAVVAAARETFVLTDSSKFGRAALSRICGLGEVAHLITDQGIPEEYRCGIEDTGVRLHVA